MHWNIQNAIHICVLMYVCACVHVITPIKLNVAKIVALANSLPLTKSTLLRSDQIDSHTHNLIFTRPFDQSKAVMKYWNVTNTKWSCCEPNPSTKLTEVLMKKCDYLMREKEAKRQRDKLNGLQNNHKNPIRNVLLIFFMYNLSDCRSGFF